MRKALYFPYIAVPRDAWFTRVLLYWESAGTIVPGGLEDDPRFVTRQMRELQDEGLLEFVSPAFEFQQMPRFEPTFMETISADPEIARRRQHQDDMSYARVHVWKLGMLADALKQEGLARPAAGPGWELWLEVEERTATLFMAYLAATLAALHDVAMDPVTDRPDAMAALSGIHEGAGLTLRRAREHRLAVLEKLLPSPAGVVRAADLRRFKEAHCDQLARFRDLVDEELMKIGALPELDARIEQTRISTRRLVRERDDLRRLMEARRWPRIAFYSVAGVVAAAAGIAAPLVVGGGLAAAGFAAPGLIPAVYGALREARTAPDFGTRPLAYAALAQRQFR